LHLIIKYELALRRNNLLSEATLAYLLATAMAIFDSAICSSLHAYTLYIRGVSLCASLPLSLINTLLPGITVIAVVVVAVI